MKSTNLTILLTLQVKKEVTAVAPIMHPLFGAVDPQHQMANDPGYEQQNYGGQQFAPIQAQIPPPSNQQAGFYQPLQKQQQQYQPQQTVYEFTLYPQKCTVPHWKVKLFICSSIAYLCEQQKSIESKR